MIHRGLSHIGFHPIKFHSDSLRIQRLGDRRPIHLERFHFELSSSCEVRYGSQLGRDELRLCLHFAQQAAETRLWPALSPLIGNPPHFSLAFPSPGSASHRVQQVELDPALNAKPRDPFSIVRAKERFRK